MQARRRRECRRRLSWPLEAGSRSRCHPALLSLSAGAQRPRHANRGMLSGADGSQAPPGLAGAPELPGLFAAADRRRTGHCGTERSCVRALTTDRPRSVTAGILRPGPVASSSRGGQARGGNCGQRCESPRPATGRQAGRLRMDPAGVPVKTPLRLPGRPATVRWQIWQRVTIRSRDTGPVAVTVPCIARAPHSTDQGSWFAGRVNSG
jgi:hypothetical protein